MRRAVKQRAGWPAAGALRALRALRALIQRAVKRAGLGVALGSSVLVGGCHHTPTEAEKQAAEARRLAADGPALTSLYDSTLVAQLTAYGRQHPGSEVVLHTSLGAIGVRLYDDTPLHRANFLLLARRKFFDEGVFYRVLKDFVIQGGDDQNRTMALNAYKIPSEVRPAHFHRRGALAMARHGDERNPTRASSSHDFYLVQGKLYTDAELDAIARDQHLTFSPEQRAVYKTLGGAPSLDAGYTVFGEVTSGLEVVKKIADVPVDAQKWPRKDVTMRVEVVK